MSLDMLRLFVCMALVHFHCGGIDARELTDVAPSLQDEILGQIFYNDSGCNTVSSGLAPVEHFIPPTNQCRSLGKGEINGVGSIRREPYSHASIVPSHLDISPRVWEFDRYSTPFVSNSPWGWDYGPIDRKVSIFDNTITIYADQNILDSELQHIASVTAEFLDNNEDGVLDNLMVAETLRSKQAILIVHHERTPGERTGSEPRDNIFNSFGSIQTLESKISKDWLTPNPTFVDTLDASQDSGLYDATLEEVWHLISVHGYGPTYPAMWSREPDDSSHLQTLMDVARGGKFDSDGQPYEDAAIATYPKGAWYTRTDACWYGCFIDEYIHWAWSTLAGAQKYRQDQDYQWKLFTPKKLFKKDPAVVALLQDCEYNTPRNLPNGKYTVSSSGHGPQFEFCAGGQQTSVCSDPVITVQTFSSQDCSGPAVSQNSTIVLGTCMPSVTHAGKYEMYDCTRQKNNVCLDNPKFFKTVKGKKRKCRYFGKKKNIRRCSKKNVIENCRASCKVCGKDGEAVCERPGEKTLKENACKTISCCQWDDSKCFSNVGKDKCWP